MAEAETKRIKLIRKTSQTFLWISFILMLVSTIALYFYVKNLMLTEVEEELFSTKARVEAELSKGSGQFSLAPVVEVANVASLHAEILKDTIIYDPSQDEMEEFRELISFKEINGEKYKITVRNLIVESEDILIAIIFSYIIIILLVFAFLFYFNKSRNQKLWLPFFSNLEQMKKFSLSSPEPLQLVESEIVEFHELNKEIDTLTQKVRTDYLNLKQFTENVSHEIQTPLAIIQAKIDNIINGNNLNDIQYEHLTSIQKDIQRLTQMNKRLTLLTKIENRQFMNIEKVSLTDVMAAIIENFHEISAAEIKYDRKNEIWAKMDPHLAEVLCTNLISNAIKYNTEKGDIEVTAKDKLLSVSNYGTAPLSHPENLYARFYRENEGEKSTGLGLAIVKRICDLYGFLVGYEFKEGKHVFSVSVDT
ncbi:sensor histidine kinase [Maribacter luteus]|uniref:sensor histidine kinase n=1 Tax=Maribacter luteus TaxID=2594478 RepID=UPI00249111AF|nr:HAMP domain-containing sensor histidine kinase [Maribacter luteus]